MSDENPFARLFTKQPNTVQLAVLLPGTDDSPICLTLTSADPTDTAYQCISYDRSRKHETCEVSVNDEPLAIPKPLEAALRALRMSGQPRTLWADLLIGNSEEERSKQASVAKLVLANADRTNIWLGPGSEHTPAAFDIVQTLANRWQQMSLVTNFPQNLSRATQQQMLGLFEYFRSKSTDDLQPSNVAAWKIATALLSCSYFKSMQSIPDIVLAKQAVVCSGDKTISWHDFVNAGRAALFIMAQQLSMTVSEEQQTTFALIASIELAERRRREGESVELLPMIQSSQDCTSADPREIVFSMIPIATPSLRTAHVSQKEPLPTVDYTKSVQEVFTEAARYIVYDRQDLLLWWTERPPRGRKILNMPSWVPDWSSPQSRDTVKVMPTQTNGMRAWWDHISPPAKQISVDEANALHVQAHALDRIVSVSPIFTQENCRRLCLKEWQALPTQPGESLDNKVQKMFRTLILNQAGMGATIRDSAPPPRDMWVSWQSVVAEERICELMGCTLQEMMASPEIVERAKVNADCALLGPQTGRSQAFEEWLRQNAIGRRFFRTESGRTGMTAVEELPDGVAPAEGEPPAPDFDHIMGDPLARMMLGGFQEYVNQRDPQAASVLSRALSGELPGQALPGARSGDLVVALVGGFQPYVLRPISERRQPGESAAQSLEAISKYTYVGDCYLHGVMDGEPFKTKGWFGRESWTRDVRLVDISIE